MKYGFLDEAGDVGTVEGASNHLVVAVVLISHPHWLRRAVARTRKGLRKKLKNIPELKAKRTPKKIVAKLLGHVAELDVEIIAVVLDKRGVKSPPDPEDWYRHLCARVAQHCVERHPNVSLALDKRYTNQRLRDLLVQAITEKLEAPAVLVIGHSDSAKEGALQAADAVVWSLFERYERGDEELYEIIKEKLIIQEVLRQ